MEHTGVHQFELVDARGVAHSYIVTEHPAGEGMDIMYALLGLGAPTVLGLAAAALKSEELLGAVLGALRGDGDDVGAGDVAALGGMLAGLDLASVGAELGRALGTGQAPALTRKVLSRVHRDGRPLSSNFDAAFQANYAELLQLTWKVCTINRFFPVPSTSADSSSAETASRVGSLPAA